MARNPTTGLRPESVAPYFVLVALVHAAAVATRFDLVAAKIPEAGQLAIMLSQFPLIVLSGYFEGRLDHGPTLAGLPLWMRIRSKPVKLAFTFGFMYVACVVLQTLHFSIGPIDPTPPLAFPPAQRALWFAMFSAGMFFPFYLAATGILIPILRVLTRPLRALPLAIGAVVALGLGVAAGVVIDALATKTKVTAFVDLVHDAINTNPLLLLGVTLGMIFIPMLIGVALGKRAD
ncbi:MAG: hypothetical protein ABI591_25385 [Kofleriaceae bacterium]